MSGEEKAPSGEKEKEEDATHNGEQSLSNDQKHIEKRMTHVPLNKVFSLFL